MKLGSTDNSNITVGFREKASPMAGYVKPLFQVACFAALTYLGADRFDKGEVQTILLAFMTAFGIEAVNVTPKRDSRRDRRRDDEE